MRDNGGSSLSSPQTKQYCLLLAVVLVALGVVCTLFCKLPHSTQPAHGPDMVWTGSRHQTTAESYTQFIDPDQIHFQRKFYSGRLVRPRKEGDPLRVTKDGRWEQQRQSSSPQCNVTVFQPAEGPSLSGTCVPFHVPANRTLTICVHDRRVDQIISAYIHDNGVWEREQVEGMASLLRADEEKYKQDKSVSGSDVGGLHQYASRELPVARKRRASVVDIGCNVGVYTLAAASLGHEVLALDPVQSNLQLLTTSLRLANLSSRVTLLLNAVSDTRGPLTVHIQPGNIGGSWVSESRKAPRQRVPDGQLTVWAVCLNDLVPHVRTQRVFLKMDIEGWEERALRCGGHFFQQLDVCYVLMEWLFYRKNPGGPAIISFMVRNGLLPYSDSTRTAILEPGKYYSWPDNIVWIKR